MTATTLVIDGMNFCHRARSGFQSGSHSVTYNFFRQLKAVVEEFRPTRVIFVLEGHPKRRYELLPSYKANRLIDGSTEEGKRAVDARQGFFVQVDEIVGLLSQRFPISVMRHPDHEGDDLIANVVLNASLATQFIVVSTDTDFIQLLQRSNVRLYNPVKKAFVAAPGYDYVRWKALRGDGSDNIPAVAGVSDGQAAKILAAPGDIIDHLKTPALVEQFHRNCELIRFVHLTDEELQQVHSSSPARDWDAVKATFEGWGFASMLKEKYWDRFVSTFDTLWSVPA